MLFSPDALITIGTWASLIFLAPADATLTRGALPADVARAARAAACDAPALTLPDTIALADGLQPMVRWALEHSPTFRRQCRALAAAPGLRATVSVSYRPTAGTSRARTSFRQNRAGLAAEIEIRSVSEMTELIAHEFEHLLEQIDGVDLNALSKAGEARRLTDGAFETERAIAAGHQVAGEVVDNAPDRIRGAGSSAWRALRRVVGARASGR
jgi:hypothetical protein